jgi:hypothetical protein
MKKYIKKKIISFLKFIDINSRLKKQTSNPIDYYLEDISKECYEIFKNDIKKSAVCINDDDIRRYSILKAIENHLSLANNLFLEFGVYKAESINYFSNILKKYNKNIYGFDSFEGLEEEWITTEYHEIETFSLKGIIPKINKNVLIIKGKVHDTFEEFIFNNKSSKISFMHVDMDTYLPTKFVLEKAKPFLIKGSVILFDEFYGYPGWQNQEYKAFNEIFNDTQFEYIAFASRQVAIRII